MEGRRCGEIARLGGGDHDEVIGAEGHLRDSVLELQVLARVVAHVNDSEGVRLLLPHLCWLVREGGRRGEQG